MGNQGGAGCCGFLLLSRLMGRDGGLMAACEIYEDGVRKSSLLHPLEDDHGLGFGFWHRVVVALGSAFCARYLFALSLSRRTQRVCFDDPTIMSFYDWDMVMNFTRVFVI